ncbi:MAG TPA: elongation factor Ts [Candidatus Paceibacterota bacterium]
MNDLIKELREETGVSVMQCKKALDAAGGDKAKALAIIKEKAGEAAAKKGDRTLNATQIAAYVHSSGTVGVMIELACETDFVARNPEFKAMAYDIAMHTAATNPVAVKADGAPAGTPAESILLDQPFIKNPELTVAGLLSSATQKFGEKIEITRFTRYSA